MPIRRFAVLAVLLAAAYAQAQSDGGTPSVTATVHASYRLLAAEQTDLELGLRDTGDAEETLGHRWFVEHQIRVGGTVQFRSLELVAEANVVNGLLGTGAADEILPTPVIPEGGALQPVVADPVRNRAWGLNPSALSIRQLMVKWKTKYGVLAGGATTFNFGLGLLANDAGNMIDPGFDRALGDQRFGDRVVRASFTTRPGEVLGATGFASKIVVSLAADLVLEDSTARLVRPIDEWNRGVFADRAVQGVLAVVWHDTPGQAGFIITRRSIFFADSEPLDPVIAQRFGTDLSAWAFDVAAEGHHQLSSTVRLQGGLEAALVTGSTNHVRNDACPGVTDAQRCQVLQGGAIAKAGVTWNIVTAELLGGFASGDSNPFDASVNNFKIARDFQQAGFILFDQVLAWQSAAEVRRASDPRLLNTPPAGVELLSTNGAITNALFLQPTVKVQVHRDVEVLGSVLWARAPAPYTDALWSTRTARPTNAWGQPAGSSYGLELDLGANWKRTFGQYTFHAGLAAGVLLPGDAFVIDSSGKTMAPVHRVKLRLGVWF